MNTTKSHNISNTMGSPVMRSVTATSVRGVRYFCRYHLLGLRFLMMTTTVSCTVLIFVVIKHIFYKNLFLLLFWSSLNSMISTLGAWINLSRWAFCLRGQALWPNSIDSTDNLSSLCLCLIIWPFTCLSVLLLSISTCCFSISFAALLSSCLLLFDSGHCWISLHCYFEFF